MHIWVYILYCLYFVGSPCSGAMITEQQLIYIELRRRLLQLQQIINGFMGKNRTKVTVHHHLGHLFRIIPHISNFEVQLFAFSARNPGRVSLSEFPTSDCLRNNSVKWPNHAQCRISQWPGQFPFYICRSLKWTAWHLYEHIVRRERAQRHMPEAADAVNEIKRHCWCTWQWWPNAKKSKK